MNLRCIAVDDEPLALKQMVAYVEKTPFLELVGASTRAIEGLEMVNRETPDLLFADINMPDLNGIELAKSLSKPCMVIFTTAYSEYAIEGFKVDAVDYLLKPIGYSDFLKAANKAHQLHNLKHTTTESVSESDTHLFVRSEYRLVRIPFSDIKYIEGMREYVRIHLSDGNAIMTLLSMKSLEERLPKGSFMRVHRSFIVNLSKISIIERNRIVFDKNVYIPIGDQYKEAFDHYISKSFL